MVAGTTAVDLERVQRLKLRTRRLIDSAYSGDYHSIFKGRGLEFAEVRDYAPGDDVRAIDWNITARSGRPHVKLFVEERELTVMLLVDVSASTRVTLAGKAKAEVVALTAATLAMSALRHNDRVGLILFSDSVVRFIRPRKGRNQVMNVIDAILGAPEMEGGTDLAAALDALASTVRVRTVSFLLSDFFAAPAEQQLRRATRRHDLIPVAVQDAYDWELPPAGLLSVLDPESGVMGLIDSDDPVSRDTYAKQRREVWNSHSDLFQRLGLDHVQIDSRAPVLPPLMRLFSSRARRSSRAR